MNITEAALAWLGPVSSARPGGVGGFVYILCLYFLLAIVWQAFGERKRTIQVRRFAEKWNLTFLGASVPTTLPLHRTEAFRWARSVRRAMIGSSGSKEIVIFDCTVGYGRGRRPRTVVAARGQQNGFGWAQFGPDIVAEKAGEWMFVYGSDRLLSIGEIDALLSEFSVPAQNAI